MAARTLHPRHQEEIRAKIKVGSVLERLAKFVAGDKEKIFARDGTFTEQKVVLSAAQVSAAKLLLDKGMSNAPIITENTNLNMNEPVDYDLANLSEEEIMAWKLLREKVSGISQSASVMH